MAISTAPAIQEPIDQDGLAFLRVAAAVDRNGGWFGKQLSERIDALVLMSRHHKDVEVADLMKRKRGYVRSTRKQAADTVLKFRDQRVA